MSDIKAPCPRLGCHLSIGKGLDVTASNAAKIGAETFQVFLRNPRGAGFRVWKDREIQKFKETLNEHGIYPVVAHIPYIVNPASPRDDLYELARRVVTEDLNRCDILEAPYLVLHPGSRGDGSTEEAIDRLISLVNNVLEGSEGKAMLLIETMAGMGKEICSTFDEMKLLWSGINRKDRLGLCFDSCHLFAAGYDVATSDGLSRLLDEIDNKIGIHYLKVVHINDCLRELGSHIDRHAPIGKGQIGVDGIANIMKNPLLQELPFILETPTIEQDLKTLREIRASIYNH